MLQDEEGADVSARCCLGPDLERNPCPDFGEIGQPRRLWVMRLGRLEDVWLRPEDAILPADRDQQVLRTWWSSGFKGTHPAMQRVQSLPRGFGSHGLTPSADQSFL